MLELRLFGDLLQYQQLEAAIISTGRDPDIRELPIDQRPSGIVDKELELIIGASDDNVVVTGVDHEEKVVAVYTMPIFLPVYISVGQPERNFLMNFEFGYLITEPSGPPHHHGSNVFQSLKPIFESSAYALGVDELFHNVSSLPGSLLTRLGYEDLGRPVLDKVGHHRYRGHFMPQNHTLGANQEAIIEAFGEKLVSYVNNL